MSDQPTEGIILTKKSPKRFQILALAGGFLLLLLIIPTSMGIGRRAMQNAQLERCRVQIKLFENKLQEYEADRGELPPGDGSDKSSRELFKALYEEGILHDSKVYMPHLDPKVSEQFRNRIKGQDILDPFNHNRPFFYLPSVDENGNSNKDVLNSDFDLWSVGPDGIGRGDAESTAADRKDDVHNW